MVPGREKAKRLLSVNHSAKTIHQPHYHHQYNLNNKGYLVCNSRLKLAAFETF